MPKRRIVDLREGPEPLLNIASFGRRGPGYRPPSKAEIAHITRTIRRTPEAVVKVTGGARSLRGVAQHLDYIGREGRGEVQTDDGERLQGKGFQKDLMEDWDLDLEALRRRSERAIVAGRRPPKLVHNLVFSMPKGTPPDKLLRAVQVFAREKFALKHRYAMALHVEQGHPHVHMLIKAVSEQGARVYIRKPMLREWRQDFAKYLGDLGVEANATERAVRGETRAPKRDGIHRAMLRGKSTHMRARANEIARELAAGGLTPGSGKRVLLETRKAVLDGWRGLAECLERDGNPQLASTVRRFADTMPPPLTEKEHVARQIEPQLVAQRAQERAPTR
jgi:MobA/VirD2-like, nuclease domain